MIVIIMTIMIMMMIMIMKLITKFPLKRPIWIAVFGKAEGSRGLYENWDFDQDGKITIDEVRTIQYSICKKKHPTFVTCQISNVDEYKIIFFPSDKEICEGRKVPLSHGWGSETHVSLPLL